MSRRYLVVPALLALAAMPALASEAGGDVAAIRESIVRMTPRIELAELFARLKDSVPVETEDGVSSPAHAMEVVVARIGADGKLVMACVDHAEAVERFFSVPVGQLRNRKAANQ
jgi:hypothetical protein